MKTTLKISKLESTNVTIQSVLIQIKCPHKINIAFIQVWHSTKLTTKIPIVLITTFRKYLEKLLRVRNKLSHDYNWNQSSQQSWQNYGKIT